MITDISVLVSGDRGPCSKYDISIPEGDFKGELEIIWEGDPLKVRRSITCVDHVVPICAYFGSSLVYVLHKITSYLTSACICIKPECEYPQRTRHQLACIGHEIYYCHRLCL